MIEIIREKLTRYSPTNAVELENATKEIFQEIALYALWRADFFDIALFQGGTSLRILHGLPRFSEDLDFILRSGQADFSWPRYLDMLVKVFADFGLALDAIPRGGMDGVVRQAVLKDNSVANQLDIRFAGDGKRKAIRIKLEIDTHPPALTGEDKTYLDFPADYEVRHQDLASNFALKIHALLCRGFLKGRDWFDFSWYVARGVIPNLPHLQEALKQKGPWQGNAELAVDATWVDYELGRAISVIDWREAADDVRRFLRPAELKSLELWSEDFFRAKLRKLILSMPLQ